MNSAHYFRTEGFTLVEMAIVLAIVALILGTGLTLLSAQQDQRRIEDTNAALSDASEALIGFALTKTPPSLPCPDSTAIVSGSNAVNDGQEDRNAITLACDALNGEGNLPWVTLGLTPSTDAWSNRLRYRVTPAFSNGNTGMLLTSTGDIDVRDAVAGNLIASNVSAVIISHGRNGLGAINATGHANPLPLAASPDELANTDGNPNFVSHPPTPAGAVSQTGAAVGYFDDQLTWISPNILFNRMVQAGKLP